MTITIPLVHVGEHAGYLFDSAAPGSYCFVPCDCVTFEDGLMIDVGKYLVSGWAERNMGFSRDFTAGSRLFPIEAAPVMDVENGGPHEFLRRIRQANERRHSRRV